MVDDPPKIAGRYTYALQFSRDTKGEFFWKTELKQFSALDGECFWIEFEYFGVLEEFELVFIPCWDENPMIRAHINETSWINLSKEIIPEALLFYMTKSQLALLRNAFYAIHGYKFKNPKYAEYFGHEVDDPPKIAGRYTTNGRFRNLSFSAFYFP